MGNFIGLAFSTLKKAGIDTKNMSIEEVIAKYNEINASNSSKPLTDDSSGGKIILPKQEYGRVGHALATKYADKFVKATAISIDNIMYIVKNVDCGHYECVDKIDIEEYRDLIEMLEEEDDW